jgi:hypothetical protein
MRRKRYAVARPDATPLTGGDRVPLKKLAQVVFRWPGGRMASSLSALKAGL